MQYNSNNNMFADHVSLQRWDLRQTEGKNLDKLEEGGKSTEEGETVENLW